MMIRRQKEREREREREGGEREIKAANDYNHLHYHKRLLNNNKLISPVQNKHTTEDTIHPLLDTLKGCPQLYQYLLLIALINFRPSLFLSLTI